MRSQTIFKEYIWLINTISRAKSITLQEINRKWMETDMSEGKEMARTTFNRHRTAIEEIFGIHILCNSRNGHQYYIENADALQENSIQNWMISTLSVNNLIGESQSIHHRIALESIPSGHEILPLIIEAMKKNRCIQIQYQKYGSDTPSERIIAPHCIKLFQRRWYVLGQLPDNGNYRIFSFDRIKELKQTDIKFKMDKHFRAEEFFAECFGIVYQDGTPIERIVLRAFGTERYYLKDLPLHHSQALISEAENHADFAYYFHPTLDFIEKLLQKGNRIKVLKPEWLARKVCQMHRESAALYDE